MQEQQINQKYCPPQNERLEQVDIVLQGKQRSEQIANRRLKQLHRFLPQTFTPYMNITNHYYNNNQQQHQSASNMQSNTIRLNNGHPQFSLNSLIYDRQRLSLQRQMMYCRGAVVEEIMSEDVVENMIKESGLQRGYVNKSGNKSVIVDGMLVYVHGEMIKAVVVPYYKSNNCNNRALQIYDQSMNPMTLFTFPTGTVIHQLQLFSTNNTHQHFESNKKTSNNNNKHTNNHLINNNPIILSLRLSRQIVIFNVSQQRIIHSIQTQSNSQFIGSQKSIYNVNTIQTIEYDGLDSKISRWDFGYDNSNNNSKNHYNHNGSSIQQQHSQSQQLLTIKGTLVHSMNKLTRNQTILATYQGLSMCDYRQKHITKLYSVLNMNKDKTIINSNDRIYSAIKIHSNFIYSPYLATCNTRHLCLFDIRNLSETVERRLHHFQQAPPQNMCYFDGFQQRLQKGVIVGWNSWGKYGAGIMTEVNVNGFKEANQEAKREQPILGKHFQLLSPKNSNKKQHITTTSSYLSSISLYNYSPQSLALFSTTNQGAINMHLYHHNSIKQKYQPQQILFEQSGKQKLLKSLDNNEGHSSQRWLKANLCDKYFTKVVEYQKIAQQSNQGEKTAKHQPATNNKKKKKAKTNSTSLINKKKKKHSNNNKSITENINKNNIDGQNQNVDGQMIDDQQLMLDTGEYQNQQKCEQSYSKRKLNFADLTKFYTTLKAKARQLQQQQNSYLSNKNNINTNNYPKNNFDYSLTSTQPYSQSFSLSQSFSDDFFKTYTFHNKKVLNTSMLDKLKTQWQL